jgi:uncharacterized membrane protein YhaH (DUF805 family)
MTGSEGPIGNWLRSLGRFTGRDTRKQFWLYAIVVLVVIMVVEPVILMPMLAGSMIRMQTAIVDQARVAHGVVDLRVLPEVLSMMHRATAIAAGFAVVLFVLLAAATTRRLHDAGRTGLWILLPLPSLVFGLVAMNHFMSTLGGDSVDIDAFLLLWINNAVHLVSLGVLLVLLLWPSQGPNRFGVAPDPAARSG